jgi:hypothetical protein
MNLYLTKVDINQRYKVFIAIDIKIIKKIDVVSMLSIYYNKMTKIIKIMKM